MTDSTALPQRPYPAIPDRVSADHIAEQHAQVRNTWDAGICPEAIPHIVLILNESLQIVHANAVVLDFLLLRDAGEIVGRRPGEALGCIHASTSSDGCGATEQCGVCSIMQAILNAATAQPISQNVRECRIARKRNTSEEVMNFRVRTEVVRIGNGSYISLTMREVGIEKRRRELERIFFHDLRNTTSALLSSVYLLNSKVEGADPSRLTGRVYDLVERLRLEIEGQEQLLKAEDYELQIRPSTLHSRTFLNDLVQRRVESRLAEGKIVSICAESVDVVFESDETLLERVLANMLRNALEASQPGDTITLGCLPVDAGVRFWMKNPGVMPCETRLRIFEPSSSAKGRNRGVGTYSMKLLTERFLKGRVQFSQSQEDGVTFYVDCPKTLC